jgi:prepilin-type N-terminal cleavage/methylation domain-containing protein
MRRRGFSFVEVIVVVGILGIFASLVIPGLASARLPIAAPIEHALEADLRHARTEAIARARPVVLVVARDGSGWWIASETNPGEPIDATLRTFGRGAFSELEGATIAASLDGDDPAEGSEANPILARFDATGARDVATASLVLRDANGARAATWTLPPGRTRLQPVDAR